MTVYTITGSKSSKQKDLAAEQDQIVQSNQGLNVTDSEIISTKSAIAEDDSVQLEQTIVEQEQSAEVKVEEQLPEKVKEVDEHDGHDMPAEITLSGSMGDVNAGFATETLDKEYPKEGVAKLLEQEKESSAPPVAGDDSYVTWRDHALTIPLTGTFALDGNVDSNDPVPTDFPGLLENDSDPEADPLTFALVSNTTSAGGTVTYDGGEVTYTPADDFFGIDTFKYTINDGHGNTDTATVTVKVGTHVGWATGDNIDDGTPSSEYMLGLAGNDSIYGDALDVQDSTVSGGADTIEGGLDNDNIYGDASFVGGSIMHKGELIGGADMIYSASGNDNIYGDAYTVAFRGSITGGADTISGDSGDDHIYGDIHDAEPLSSITGAADAIQGGDGNDYIYGDAYEAKPGAIVAGGADTINGGNGNDQIYGDVYQINSNSTVTGGTDIIISGLGNDTMTGDFGDTVGSADIDYASDTFVIRGEDLNPSTPEIDTISDFQVGIDGDVLALLNVLEGVNSGTSASALVNYLNITTDGTNTTIEIDKDGLADFVPMDHTIELSNINLFAETGETNAEDVIDYLLTNGQLEISD